MLSSSHTSIHVYLQSYTIPASRRRSFACIWEQSVYCDFIHFDLFAFDTYSYLSISKGCGFDPRREWVQGPHVAHFCAPVSGLSWRNWIAHSTSTFLFDVVLYYILYIASSVPGCERVLQLMVYDADPHTHPPTHPLVYVYTHHNVAYRCACITVLPCHRMMYWRTCNSLKRHRETNRVRFKVGGYVLLKEAHQKPKTSSNSTQTCASHYLQIQYTIWKDPHRSDRVATHKSLPRG